MVIFGAYWVFFLKQFMGILILLIGLIGLYDLVISSTSWYKHYIYIDVSENELILRVQYFKPPVTLRWEEIDKIRMNARKIIVFPKYEDIVSFQLTKLEPNEIKELLKIIIDKATHHDVDVIYR